MSADQLGLFRVTEAKRPSSMSSDGAPPPAGDSYGGPFPRHSDTSKAAAAALRGSQTLRALVYKAIASSGGHGMTDSEVQAHLGLSGSTQRPRRVRLVELGFVRDSGNRRASKTGRLCTVWIA